MKKLLLKILTITFALTLCLGAISACGENETPSHTHDYKTLKYDTENHWYECECKEKTNLIPHTLVNNRCLCGYVNIIVREGDYIYFGEYPQTIKEDSVIVNTTTDSRGYYLGSDNNYYAKVVANPYDNNYKFSNNMYVVDGQVYYFKVEPIKWRILSEDNGTALILCDSAIETKRFDDNSNNYKESEIRAWLNNEFLITAFNTLQQQIILTTTVDNSVESTGYSENKYACEDTLDKVFLLSYKEATNISYGLYEYKNRQMQTSDYARANRAHMDTDRNCYGNALWWLRSPECNYVYYARNVDCDGDICYYNLVYWTAFGVVPALQIKLL